MTGSKGTILVVDDELDSLKLLTGILTERKYRVRPANSGKLALTSVSIEPPELILLDVRMPGMDGFEVCRQLKRAHESHGIPVIFLSASTNVEEHVLGLSLGAVDFITKPIRKDELLARVRTHIELGRLQTRLEELVAERTTALRGAIEQLQSEMVERRRVEAGLQESEERFRSMADAAPVMVWASGTDKLFTFFNRGWLEFTGRQMAEELGDGWASGVHPEDLDSCCATYCSSFDARRSFEMEYRLRRSDGEYRWVLDKGVPRFEPGGIFAGYVGSCTDITEVKRAQEQSLARQKLESMGLMAAGIAHDFNNLLGSILGSIELLDERDGSSSYQEEVQTINTAAMRGVELVRELMIYAGRESKGFEPVDIVALVDEIFHLLRAIVPKRVTLKLDFDKNLLPVRANLAQLRQVIMNLITNASEAIGDRPGEICVAAQLAKVSGKFTASSAAKLPAGDYLRLRVSDNGSGITSDVQARMFDPFFSTKDAGRGLGLAVVQGIVYAHGGAITVTSDAGKGTMFEILLPRASQVAQRERAATITHFKQGLPNASSARASGGQ
jgi:PAS domain S-box-containing protein